MGEKGYSSAGYYAVVHFGTDGEQRMPLFLKANTDCDFTANMGNAEFFTSVDSALAAADRSVMALRRQRHPLAGGIMVAELFCRPLA